MCIYIYTYIIIIRIKHNVIKEHPPIRTHTCTCTHDIHTCKRIHLHRYACYFRRPLLYASVFWFACSIAIISVMNVLLLASLLSFLVRLLVLLLQRCRSQSPGLLRKLDGEHWGGFPQRLEADWKRSEWCCEGWASGGWLKMIQRGWLKAIHSGWPRAIYICQAEDNSQRLIIHAVWFSYRLTTD